MREGCEACARDRRAHLELTGFLAYGYGGALARQDLEAAAGIAGSWRARGGARTLQSVLHHHFRAWEAMLRRT